jgi:hypothetical protein
MKGMRRKVIKGRKINERNDWNGNERKGRGRKGMEWSGNEERKRKE